MKEWFDFFYYVFLKRVHKLNPKADIKEMKSSASYHVSLIQGFILLPLVGVGVRVLPDNSDSIVFIVAILIVIIYVFNSRLLESTDYYKRLFEKYDHIDPELIAKRRMRLYQFNWVAYIVSYSTLFYL